ncbi:MAG: GNAT family N-acetyltransferase [Gammaproteobacteria bacterium]|jgi:GNAT superfamily N-acetyltransferase|nr:GNAT family N-acetyltransferase [Gammaproteobacteria bacterium]
MIRAMTKSDFELFWPCFKRVINAQETYAFDPNISFDEAFQIWCVTPRKTFVLQENNQILGSYYIKPNAQGPGAHICNCGYMVDEAARGKGVAQQLCEHSQQIAIELGFAAMQFNAVVSTNRSAVRLWLKLGFTVIGTIPEAYYHAKLGYVDSYIMYKKL